MTRALICASLLATLGTSLGAQDLVPNARRGVQHVVGQLAVALPAMEPVPSRLALVVHRDSKAMISGLLTQELVSVGFDVRMIKTDRDGQKGDLVLLVKDEDAAPYRRLTLSTTDTPAKNFAVRYGDADWVDEAVENRLVVEGPLEGTAPDALAAAREAAWRRLLARADLSDRKLSGDGLKRFATRVFLGEAVAESGSVLSRAYVAVEGVDAGLERLVAEKSREDRKKAREPLIRIGASVLLGAVLLVTYLFADLKTRGYMSGPLRLLFGILLLIGLFACWRVTS